MDVGVVYDDYDDYALALPVVVADSWGTCAPPHTRPTLPTMKRPDDTLLTKTADGLTRCPRCRRHVQAGATPRDRHCPFCTAGAAPRFGLRGGMVAASLMGLGACGPSAAEEQARQQAIQQEEAQRAESLRQAAAIEAAEAAERARAVEVAAAEAAAAEAAAAEAAARAAAAQAAEEAAAAAAAAAEEAQPRARRRRAPGDPEYTPMGPDRAPAVTYGLDF